MYARATVVVAEQSKIDELVALVRDVVVPAQDAQAGTLGLSMNVDRATGRCTLTEVWKDRASMHASEPALAPLQERAGRVAGAPLATESYEVAALHRLRQAEPGCWVRTTRLRLDPGQVDAGVRSFRASTLPEVEQLPGFRSALLLVDRRTGSGVVSAVFDDRAALEASRQAAAGVRTASSERASASVTDVVESEIVVAALHLPLHSETETAVAS